LNPEANLIPLLHISAKHNKLICHFQDVHQYFLKIMTPCRHTDKQMWIQTCSKWEAMIPVDSIQHPREDKVKTYG